MTDTVRPTHRLELLQPGHAVILRSDYSTMWTRVLDMPFEPAEAAPVTQADQAGAARDRDLDQAEDLCPHCRRALPSLPNDLRQRGT